VKGALVSGTSWQVFCSLFSSIHATPNLELYGWPSWWSDCLFLSLSLAFLALTNPSRLLSTTEFHYSTVTGSYQTQVPQGPLRLRLVGADSMKWGGSYISPWPGLPSEAYGFAFEVSVTLRTHSQFGHFRSTLLFLLHTSSPRAFCLPYIPSYLSM
jgi:hypothetical protein